MTAVGGDLVGRYDVAVVGGGIAGVSLAYELAADRSVVLLEREEQLAVHTTGRSAAAYLTTYGNAIVRGLTRASRADFDALEERFATPPLLTPRGVLWITAQDTPQAMAALTAGGGHQIDVAEAARRCPALRTDALTGASVADGFDVDVMALHGGYVRGLLDDGGHVLRAATVEQVSYDGGRWRLELAGSAHPLRDGPAVRSVDAEVVVNATGAWGDVLARRAGVAPLELQPLRRTIFTSPVDGHAIEHWPLVLDVEERFYFKPEGPALLVSPGDEMLVEPEAQGYDDLDVARAMEAVNEVTDLELRRVTSAWSGLRTFAPDRSPVVGVPADVPGFFWYVGQGGYGIQMAPALARTGAALVRGELLPADVVAEGVDEVALSPDRFRHSHLGATVTPVPP